MIRKTCCALLPFQAGLLAAFLIGGRAWIAVFFAMGIAMLVFAFCRSKRAYTAVITLSFCAGVVSSCVYTAVVYDKTTAFDGQSVSVKGYVYDMNEYDGGSFRITVKGKINDEVSAKTSFYIDEDMYDSLTYGDEVTVYGELHKITDSLAYQSERSSKANGIFLRGGKAERIVREGVNSHRVFRFARELRDSTYERLCKTGGEGGKYLGAMICGDRSGVDDTVSEEMYRAGIGHIFAFSGTHIVIIISAAAVFLETLNKRRYLNVSLLLAVTWGLVLFSGLSLSAVRAAVMMTIMQLSTLAKQRSDPLTSLSIAGFLIAVSSPYCVASNSFILSFAGSFACSVYADALGERMHMDKMYPPVGTKRTLIAVFSTGLLLMPINALLFGRVSIISPVTNLMMIPICSISMVTCLAGLVLSPIKFVSDALIWYSSVMLKGCITITGAFSRLPFASVSTYHLAVKAAVVFMCCLPVIIMLLSYKKLMLFGMYALTSAVMLTVSALSSYAERDTLHIIAYSCGGKEALVVYDTEEAVFATYDGGRLCYAALDTLYLNRGLERLDGVVSSGVIPDMELMTSARTSYSSSGYQSSALGSTELGKDTINFTYDDKAIVITDKKVYNYIDGYKYDIDESAVEITFDRKSGECRVRRLGNGFDNTVRP